MMKKLLPFILFLFIASRSYCQYIWEYGVMAGAANYLGEIGGKEKTRRNFIFDLKLSETKSAFGGFIRYKIKPSVYLKGSVGWYRISGADKFSTNPGRVGRNLSFRNDIVETSLTGQYVFYDIADVGRTYRYQNDFKAYIFTGIAGSYHNPKAEYNGSWVPLAPLHTEGQGIAEGAPKPYSKFILAVPAGAGFFLTFSKKYRIGWEFNWRTTFTDYLDDVSTVYADPALLSSDAARNLANRNKELVYVDDSALPVPENYFPHSENGVMKYPKRGDPKHNDSYLTTTINFSYVFRGNSKFGQVKYKSFFGQYKKGRTIRAKF
jgi:Domain of unknown function (DUF6089)